MEIGERGVTNNSNASSLVAARSEIYSLAQMLNRKAIGSLSILHQVHGDKGCRTTAAPTCRITTQPRIIDRARSTGKRHRRQAIVLACRSAGDHRASFKDARYDWSVDCWNRSGLVLAQVKGLGAAGYRYARDGDIILDSNSSAHQQASIIYGARRFDGRLCQMWQLVRSRRLEHRRGSWFIYPVAPSIERILGRRWLDICPIIDVQVAYQARVDVVLHLFDVLYRFLRS